MSALGHKRTSARWKFAYQIEPAAKSASMPSTPAPMPAFNCALSTGLFSEVDSKSIVQTTTPRPSKDSKTSTVPLDAGDPAPPIGLAAGCRSSRMRDANYLRVQAELCLEIARQISDQATAENLRAEATRYQAEAAAIEAAERSESQ